MQAFHQFNNLHDVFHAWGSFLARVIVPQTYPFPEFISWFSENYAPSKQAIISKKGVILFHLNSESIHQMFRLIMMRDIKPLKESNLMA
jgi:hypothetical protein|uniref:Uncharacterized protein n=1 Tax=Picea sitchensis TaxID=3332 RepID=A0A6B9XXB8_PICSI|nr:hypothetical protein Q903MT_gene6838 [Picea sitchensis]